MTSSRVKQNCTMH